MWVHPLNTAHHAVEACERPHTATTNDYDAGWQAGHEEGLCAAMIAVAQADSLTAKLFDALVAIAKASNDGRRTAALPNINRLASEAIAKATGIAS